MVVAPPRKRTAAVISRCLINVTSSMSSANIRLRSRCGVCGSGQTAGKSVASARMRWRLLVVDDEPIGLTLGARSPPPPGRARAASHSSPLRASRRRDGWRAPPACNGGARDRRRTGPFDLPPTQAVGLVKGRWISCWPANESSIAIGVTVSTSSSPTAASRWVPRRFWQVRVEQPSATRDKHSWGSARRSDGRCSGRASGCRTARRRRVPAAGPGPSRGGSPRSFEAESPRAPARKRCSMRCTPASPLVRSDPGLLVKRDPWDGSASV